MTAIPIVRGQHAFIAYRRECGHTALRLARTLRRSGRKVFRDIEGLRGGDDWAETVRVAIDNAGAVLVLIDSSWTAAGSGGRDPRLWNDNDPLRTEIRHAIERDIAVIPVLVDDAQMPEPAELPQDLQALCGRHALRLRHTELEADVRRIASDLEHIEEDCAAISAVTATPRSKPGENGSVMGKPLRRKSVIEHFKDFTAAHGTVRPKIPG